MSRSSVGQLGLHRRVALNLADNLRKSYVREHPLRQLFWESTLRCNLSCRHCGSDCKATAGCKDMPVEDFIPVLDSIAAATDPHRVMVIISGGEPLMRKDLERCGRIIYEKGFAWGMVTNGYALTPARYRQLLQSGLRSMTISLDGLQDNHDWMRGREGSFERAVAAIRMVTRSNAECPDPERAIAFDVVTCVNRRNYAQRPQIRDLLIDAGVKEWRLFTVFPVGRAANDPELKLTPEEFRGLMEFIKDNRKGGPVKASYGCEGFLGRYEGDVRDGFFFCRAGVSVGGVLSDGSISACTSIRSDYHQGNIYRDDFMEVWNTRFQPYRDRSWMRKGDCASCRWWKHCEGGGMHLRDASGNLLFCHYQKLTEPGRSLSRPGDGSGAGGGEPASRP